MLSGDVKGAVASFDRALALDPKLDHARFNRGVARLRLNEPAAASADLEAVWNDAGSQLRAQAAYHNGIALDRLGRAAEAEVWLDRAAQLDPKLDAARLYAGVLRERRGDVEGAARRYLDYLKAHPDSVPAMLRLGISAQKAGRLDVARTYLGRVVSTAPSSAEAVEARKFLLMWE